MFPSGFFAPDFFIVGYFPDAGPTPPSGSAGPIFMTAGGEGNFYREDNNEINHETPWQ